MNRSVLLVVSSLAAGGAERVISELANAWAEKGWRVGLLTISNATVDHYPLHAAVKRIGLDLLWNSTNLWQSLTSNIRRNRMLRSGIKGFDPDVVISFVDQTNIRVLAATAGLGVPVIVSERIDPRRHQIGGIWSIARRLLYPMADAVVVQTETVAQWALRFLRASKIRVIPNFARKLPEPTIQRETGLLLAVGRLDRQKGFDLLLEAFVISECVAHGFRLVIVGGGPERSALRDQATRLGIDRYVAMPGVSTAPEDWMARATIFALPSRYEGFPNSLVEAMAMGCPVIAANCESGPREIVRNEHDGLLVPPEDVCALADAIVRLRDDAKLRERLGQTATTIRDRFAMPPILCSWESLVDEVCEK